MQFKDPVFFVLIVLIPLFLFIRLKRERRVTLKFSALDILKEAMPGGGGVGRYISIALRSLAVLLIVLSLARPVKGIAHTRIFSEGIDIICAIDVSQSMDARDMTDDLNVNRLDAVEDVVTKFISERKSDRIGIVAFARYAYTQAPLTLDHDILIELVERLKISRGEEGDRTAIGSAIVTAVARLKESKARGRVIILVTDGRNNYGKVGPVSAAEIAKSLDIKIYTIGSGKEGMAPYPARNIFGELVFTQQPLDLDSETLQKVAQITGGEFFRAQNERALEKIYGNINRMEKVKIEEEKYMEYRDLFPYLLVPGFLLLLTEIILGQTLLRRLP